jgi:hypothetical protein
VRQVHDAIAIVRFFQEISSADMKHATKQDLSYTLLSVHSEIESNWVHISSIWRPSFSFVVDMIIWS